MTRSEFTGLLENWLVLEWLRPLDGAFAEFLKREQPDCPEIILLMAALASHQLGRGHVCLDLQALLSDPEGTLSLPPENTSREQMPFKGPDTLKTLSLPHLNNLLNVSPLVADGSGNTPLVLYSGRLYLRRYWEYTRMVARDISRRLSREFPVPDNIRCRLDTLFDPLRSAGEKARTEVHWQSVAASLAARRSFSVISGGPGTGKTTTVVRLLALLQQMSLERGQKLRIRMAAPTGKAAMRLTESLVQAKETLPKEMRETLPRDVTTLHRLLGSRPDTRRFVHDASHPLHVDLLAVDEASMIDLEMMAALLGALPDDARLILLGDKDQLASVEAGAVMGDICRRGEQSCYNPETTAWIRSHTGYDLKGFEGNGTQLDQHITLLRKNHRFGENSGIGALAKAVNKGDPEALKEVWNVGFKDIRRLSMDSPDDASFARLILEGECPSNGPHTDSESPLNPQSAIRNPQSRIAPSGYRTYLERVRSGPGADSENLWLRTIIEDFAAFQLLTPLRKGVWGVEGLNETTAEILFRQGLIDATKGWYAGRPIMMTRNDYNLGLMNGDTGIVLPVKDENGPDTLKAVFPVANGSFKKVVPSRLNHFETAYAMTVHKSQGSEFRHAALVLPNYMTPVLTRELLYTAITRSREWFTVVGEQYGLLEEAVRRTAYRASGLGELLRPEA